jgi:hypothetical protein
MSNSKIFGQYWDLLERTGFDFALHDESMLPYSKAEILKEILGEYAVACTRQDETYKGILMTGVISLALFQMGVGNDPIYSLGMPYNEIPRDIEKISKREKYDLLKGVLAARDGPKALLWTKKGAESKKLISLLLLISEVIGQWPGNKGPV